MYSENLANKCNLYIAVLSLFVLFSGIRRCYQHDASKRIGKNRYSLRLVYYQRFYDKHVKHRQKRRILFAVLDYDRLDYQQKR